MDCETDSRNPRTATLKSVVIAYDNYAFSITPDLLPHLTPIKSKHLILQNFKYDFIVLAKHGLDLSNSWFSDTMLLHHLIDENAEHGLDSMVKQYFGDNYKEMFWSKYKTYEEATEDDKLEYECKDGIYTYALYGRFIKVLEDKSALVEHVHKLAKHLYLTERFGVNIDLPRIMEEAPKMQESILKIRESLRPEVETYCKLWEMEKWVEELNKRKTEKGKLGVKRPEFNFGSSTQIQWLLFSALKLPVLSKTKAGLPATDYDALEELKERHKIVELLQSYRGAKTLYNTFVEGILERQVDGRIYPEFNVNGTHTGRISSSNPNLQNMPKEGPYRGFFIPSEGMCFVGADYAQLEVIVEANLSGDRNLRNIVINGESKHDITAKELRLSRDLAKTLNFAMQYWCSPYKISELLDISLNAAQEVYDKYWSVYSGVRRLKQETDKRVDMGLPIVNLFGRERHLPSKFDTKGEESRAKRQAYNALIQGTGADITHKAFYLMAEKWIGKPVRMLWPIHDEILMECREDLAEEVKEDLTKLMCDISNELEFTIPLSAKSYGPIKRWAKT